MSLVLAVLPGEKLTYEVKYGFVKAGTLTLSVFRDTLKGEEVYHIRLSLESTPSFSKLYDVHDVFDSYVDTAFSHSILYTKKIREGKYRLDIAISYLPDSGLVRYSNGRQYRVDGYVFDPLAAIFFMREKGVREGETLKIPYHVDGITSVATVVPHSHRKVKLKWGRYSVVRVSPDFGRKGLLKEQTTLWITPYRPYIPLLIEARISFGKLSAKLIRYQIGDKDIIPLRR